MRKSNMDSYKQVPLVGGMSLQNETNYINKNYFDTSSNGTDKMLRMNVSQRRQVRRGSSVMSKNEYDKKISSYKGSPVQKSH